MKPIVTITMNPAIDGACEVDEVRPTRKLRTTEDRYEPGGGGINVARVVTELGRPAVPVYLGGGATGAVLDELLIARGFEPRRVPMRGHTRISHTVFERSSGLEYRFVPEGPCVSEQEWRTLMGIVDGLDFDYCVASGSLPRGVPDDVFVELARIVERKGSRFILDTSGRALNAAVAGARIHLLKPNLRELESLVGRELVEPGEQVAAARELIERRSVELIAISLGRDGALLVSGTGATRLQPPPAEVKSAVGAGDSFVGAMTFALAEGRSPDDALMLGVAAGTAAVLTPGTELCRRDDVWRLYEEVRRHREGSL
jgi:6-phosphofructokinase 2